jgi:SM-20-related protein
MESSAQISQSQDIKTKLLLNGGHEYTVSLKSDEPLLHQLLTTIVARAYNKEAVEHRLFQIPIEEGNSVLSFPSEYLIGIVTEPPMLVEPIIEPIAGENNQNIPSKNSDILDSHFIQIDNFFTPQEYEKLIEYVLNKESDFVSTQTSTNEVDYRRSMALYEFPEFSELIIQKIKSILPDIQSKLELPEFAISQIECQMTSHNDGNYYKIHNDNGGTDTLNRELTYVYYFYREPKMFSGGELVIYDSKVENNFYVNAESFKTVEPRNNSIVFFLSRYMHEVLPVSCPSKVFGDSRFTINGWVRK